MIRKIIKHLKHGTLFKILFNKFTSMILLKVLRRHHSHNALIYKLKFGFNKSIKYPETFSQKIYYLRDNYKDNDLATIVADKILVRKYVTAIIGGGY